MKRYLSIFFSLLMFLGLPALQAQQAPLLEFGVLPVTLANTAIDTATLSTAKFASQILTGTPTMAATYTTPTATALCALFPFLAAQNTINWSYDWWVKNTSSGSNTITMAGGSGVTLVGTGTADQNFMRHFKIQFRSCNGTPAAQLISLDTAAF